MAVGLVRTAWSGTSGGPGVTQLFVTNGNAFGSLTAAEAQSAVNAVRTFWFGLASFLPNEIVLLVSPVVDQYDVANGELVGSVSAATAPVSVVGTSQAVYSMPAGFKLNLNTGTVRNGRRVRGGIFVVPASSGAFSDGGLVSSATRTAANTAGAKLLSDLATAGLQLVVYSRPLDADQPKGPRNGAVAAVTAVETNEKGAILRGRRD